MTIHTISRQIVINTAIAALFAFVFINQATSALAQENPYYTNYNGGYQQSVYQPYQYNYNPYANTGAYYGSNTISTPLQVTTYEPAYIVTGGGVNVTLKGQIIVSDSRSLSNIWFEWGETNALENKTSAQSVNVSFVLQTTLNNLEGNKTYYYRAAGQNAQGIVYGNIITVRTPSVVARDTKTSASIFGLGSGAVTKDTSAEVSSGASKTTSAEKTKVVSVAGSNSDSQLGNNGASNVSENTNISGTNQTALSGANISGGLFPNSLLGWIVLSILVFITVGFVLYIVDLLQEMKKKQEEDAKRRANGNGNGASIHNNGISAQA